MTLHHNPLTGTPAQREHGFFAALETLPVSPTRRARALQQDLHDAAARLARVADGRSAAELVAVLDDDAALACIVDLVAVALAQEVGR